VQLASRLLSVAESGYYEWRSRPPSARAIRHVWLTEQIRADAQDVVVRAALSQKPGPTGPVLVTDLSTSARHPGMEWHTLEPLPLNRGVTGTWRHRKTPRLTDCKSVLGRRHSYIAYPLRGKRVHRRRLIIGDTRTTELRSVWAWTPDGDMSF
jgi:hypothetical protein